MSMKVLTSGGYYTCSPKDFRGRKGRSSRNLNKYLPKAAIKLLLISGGFEQVLQVLFL